MTKLGHLLQWLATCAACGLVAMPANGAGTQTPIEHLIIIVGENHTFDNIYGAYRPRHGQTVMNLLSQGIIDDDGRPGPNFDRAAQSIADSQGAYSLNPSRVGVYDKLPQPDTTYATGQPGNIPDPRFPANLSNGPFQISRYAAYSDFVGDPVHRFFQMWQQVSEGRSDLFVWVADTAGIGNHNDGFGTTPDNTHQGGVAMGFYNMNTGDAPSFKQMADFYAISDNYHQPIMGGTGANFLALATGDLAFYNSNGMPAVPPTSFTFQGTLTSQVENPNPQPAGANTNWYTEDGYRGGSYINCSDAAQPGVTAILDHLNKLKIKPNCAANTYYLVNNYNLGYKANGTLANPTLDPTQFTLPPQPASLPTIADSLSASGVSWKWYSGGRGNGTAPTADYCGICDPFTGFTSVMTDPAKRANLQDLNNLYADIAGATVPAVAFVRPLEQMAGHPANATIALYENFVTNLVNMVHDHPDLWNKTAILITVDEGGGYYDSGYVQSLDFFGDGTRIPIIAVSPYAKEGLVDHTYYDHVSILKFIERNWGLRPLSARSRDNLPNPVQTTGNYAPSNGPAIGDLMNLFDFKHLRHDAPSIKQIVSDRDDDHR